jgi:two-component system phosphate regulon sensor histidine kinase PhoR
MNVGRLVPVSFGLALLFTLTGIFFIFLDDQFVGVPDLIWYALFFVTAFVLMLVAVNINITKRVRRIQRRIQESGVDTVNGSTRTMTLDKLEETIGEWTTKQARVVQELESREEFRRDYIGNVSHELKTPIFNIQGYILTLLDGAKDDPKIAARFLKRAAKSVDRMTSLIKDMDVLSKVESGQYDIRLEPVQLNLLIEDTLQGVESYARKNDANISVDFEVDERTDVLCDSARIEQVLDNLVVNAIKYSDDNKKVEIKVEELESKVQISIKDNGFGIPEKDLGRIFERFYRVDKARSRDAGGSGLGLSIVKHIIDKHKQTITVVSKEGIGTTFKFTLDKA